MNTAEFKRLTAAAVAHVEKLEARERQVAAMAESLSQDASVQAAFRDGVHHGCHEERNRILALIEFHLVQMERGCPGSSALRALRRQVVEADT